MQLLIGRKGYSVTSLADASARYQQARGTRPSSRMRNGIVRDEQGVEIAWISYNGRVWAMGEERRLLCEAVEGSDELRRA